MKKTFGKRGVGAANGRAPSGYSASSQSTRGTASVQRAGSQAIAAGADDVLEEKEGGKFKSFAIASITGFTFSIIAMGIFLESNAPGFFAGRFFLNIVSGIAFLSFAPIVLIASRILADVMRLLRVPRGYSDVLIGVLVGSIMFLPSITDNGPINWNALAFVIGGAIGGLTYWRSRGFPGLKRKYSTAAEKSYGVVNRTKFENLQG
ncbi:MAG: hypothetical protein AAGA50_13180 [Pseudomonadota bacterium]